ncbi:helix-turn-helix domain-containing protein [Mucilaginibacter lappiensis]|uniref:Putative transcriptional regulator n=1 Tax=Mucilaginibacter lappiensis TaxID=354630 RepID=A0A841JLA3_9SPHI|nr:helix-turn-helix transcriptional regulator [Mucilaginibacter lappiensis]MBB6131800.1 putative transcriptional regulator [Mucilaginibacter lappiensis]
MTTISKINDIDLANRLKVFRTTYIDKSQNKAAKKLEVSQGNLSNMELGKIPIRYDFVKKLVDGYGLNQEWFTSGKGKAVDKGTRKKVVITDMETLNTEFETLKNLMKILEANQNHLIGIVERQAAQLKQFEQQLNEKSDT